MGKELYHKTYILKESFLGMETEALEGLMKKFELSRKQAQAVLETKLQQLTSLEREKLKKEQ